MIEKHNEFETANETKRADRINNWGIKRAFLGIEGLEPSRFLKSTDFPLPINFILVGIDVWNGTLSLFSYDKFY